jgi:hypothetical protein
MPKPDTQLGSVTQQGVDREEQLNRVREQDHADEPDPLEEEIRRPSRRFPDLEGPISKCDRAGQFIQTATSNDCDGPPSLPIEFGQVPPDGVSVWVWQVKVDRGRERVSALVESSVETSGRGKQAACSQLEVGLGTISADSDRMKVAS